MFLEQQRHIDIESEITKKMYYFHLNHSIFYNKTNEKLTFTQLLNVYKKLKATFFISSSCINCTILNCLNDTQKNEKNTSTT